MAVINFNLATLATMDAGRIAAAVQKEIDAAVADCKDRPAEKKPRKITTVYEITPGETDLTQDLENVNVQVRLKTVHPDRKTRAYSMGVKKNGTLYFNDLAPDNIHQRTIDEGLDAEEA